MSDYVPNLPAPMTSAAREQGPTTSPLTREQQAQLEKFPEQRARVVDAQNRKASA